MQPMTLIRAPGCLPHGAGLWAADRIIYREETHSSLPWTQKYRARLETTMAAGRPGVERE